MSNILSAKIEVTAPGVQQTFDKVANSAAKAAPAISKLGSSLNALKFAVLDRKEELIRTTDINRAKELNIQIKQLETEIKRLQTSGSNSFGALGASATKSFSGLRTLANILPGVGISGIVLAVSSGIGELAGNVLSLGRAYDYAAAEAEVLRSANKSVGDDVARLGALVSVAQDVTLSTNERKNAIAELQKLYPNYLRNINLENINSAATAAAIDGLTKSIINKAIAQAYSQKVAEETLKLQDKQAARDILLTKQGKAAAELQARSLTEPSNAVKKLSGLYDELNNNLQQANIETNDQQEVVNKLTERLKQATIAELDFVKTPIDKKAKAVREVKFEFDALAAIFKDLIAIQKIFSTQLEADAKVRFKIKADFSTADGRAIAGSAFKDFSKEIPAVSIELQKEVDRLTKGNIILKLGVQFTLDMSAADAQIRKDLAGLNATFRGVVEDVFGNVGETLGEALSGGDIQKSIQGLFSIIAQGITAIGKQFIHIGTLALLAKDAFTKLFKNPALSIAVGIALVAAGTSLKNSLAGGIAGARALGGPVAGGRAYLVGEKGPELFVPNTGGEIVSNSNLQSGKSIQGGGATMRIVGELLLRGNDLVAALANANRSQGRLT